jgi:hypothetical protein
MGHEQTWARLWDSTTFERIAAHDDVTSARVPAPETYEAIAPVLWTLDASEGKRFSDLLRLFGRLPDRSAQLPSLRRAFEMPPMLVLWVIPFAAVSGDFTSGPMLVAADGVYALSMDGRRYVQWCGWKDVADLTINDLGNGLCRMTLIGRESARHTAFTLVRSGECDHLEIVAAIHFQWREVVETLLADGEEIDAALCPPTAVSDTWERLGFRLYPVPTIASLQEWISAGASVDDLPSRSQLALRASRRQAGSEVGGDEGYESERDDEDDFADDFDSDDEPHPIGEDGSPLAALGPILRSWERVWRARWQPSDDGQRWEVFVPSSLYRAPDGSNRLHVTVASTDDDGVRLVLPEFIELLPDFEEGMATFREAVGSIGRSARYEYDRASGVVSVVTDLGPDSGSDGSIYRILGDLRPVFDGQFLQFLDAQGAALAAVTDEL